MDNVFENKITYKIKRFMSSSENGYTDALRIYTSSISREAKTNSNEITYWIDRAKEKLDSAELLFFGFYSNDTIIGYAEIAYVKNERLIIIDYLVVDSKYMSNSSFSTFLFLLLNYFEKNDLDYDYVVVEILVRFNNMEPEVDRIRLFENDGFKVINALYIQPRLENNNLESNKEALLMIYQRNDSQTSIRKETYFRIVKSIYFDHYHTWDNAFCLNDQERNDNYNKLLSDFEKIKSSTNEEMLSDEEIRLNGYKNKLVRNNALPPTSSTKAITSALIFTLIAAIIIMLMLFFVKEFNIEYATVGAVTITVLSVLYSFIYLIDRKSGKILEKLPLLSNILKFSDK